MDYDHQDSLVRAALRRLRDARKLLDEPRGRSRSGVGDQHLRGAGYLAGYAVECTLKVYVIRHTPRALRWSEAVAEHNRRGRRPALEARTHSLSQLLLATDLARYLDTDRGMKEKWGLCNMWRPSWRYNPDAHGPWRNRAEAENWIAAVAEVYNWVRARM